MPGLQASKISLPNWMIIPPGSGMYLPVVSSTHFTRYSAILLKEPLNRWCRSTCPNRFCHFHFVLEKFGHLLEGLISPGMQVPHLARSILLHRGKRLVALNPMPLLLLWQMDWSHELAKEL